MSQLLKNTARKYAFWALLLPLVLSSLLASGVMPVRTPDGISLVFCHSTGMAKLLPAGPQEDDDDDKPHDHQTAEHCSWSLGQMAALAPVQITLPPPEAAPTRARPVPAPTILIFTRATGLPPSTGPPGPL